MNQLHFSSTVDSQNTFRYIVIDCGLWRVSIQTKYRYVLALLVGTSVWFKHQNFWEPNFRIF